MLKNIYVGLVLHFYQPWWQLPEMLERIINECYGPIFTEIVPKMPGFCFTANINYSLLGLLENERRFVNLKYCPSKIINAIKHLAEKEKIELMGSTVHHPIMPLIPDEMQRLQLTLDTELKSACWQIKRNCKGIFLPEMAFLQKILPNLINNGYSWTVLDDAPFSAQQHGYVPYDRVVCIDNFRLYLRSNYWSNKIAGDMPPNFYELEGMINYEFPQWTKDQRAYLIIALDGETFGHHHKDLIKNLLEPMIRNWGRAGKNILLPLEEIGRIFPVQKFETVGSGSWSTTKDDWTEGNFFPLWRSTHNPHHQDFWRLIDTALKHFGKTTTGLAKFLKMTSSCHSWWISRHHWNPEFMKIGARLAMSIIQQYGAPEEIAEARKIFERLISLK